MEEKEDALSRIGKCAKIPGKLVVEKKLVEKY